MILPIKDEECQEDSWKPVMQLARPTWQSVRPMRDSDINKQKKLEALNDQHVRLSCDLHTRTKRGRVGMERDRKTERILTQRKLKCQITSVVNANDSSS